MKVPTGTFNGIANKFDQNIYGTTKGRLRHQLLVHFLSSHIHAAPMKVLDLGGGTGMMSVEFAKQGHDVTVFDMSTDVLSIAQQRLQAFDNTRCIVGDINNIGNQLNTQYDFIICHALLEWLNEPLTALLKVRELLAAKGQMSLTFFNQDAKLFSNLLYANFDYVEKGFPSKNTVRLNPHNAQKPKEVIAHLSSSELFQIDKSRGIRCFHDYINDKSKITDQYQALFDMEVKYSDVEPYKWLGKYFHLMLSAR